METKEQVSQVAALSKQTEEKALERNSHASTQPKSVVVPPTGECKIAYLINNDC